ncbi:BlaR1 family beta-lactam sensor/signal transducer [Enterococcus pallens]|uniref:BlaR1 family beta-lactam sensor/signal transducer n=1 Tax=Enterococcus pallens ATCC BAA-351 TaxID=1158607 RepID=R2SPY4_9ENTE|nr:BlaR1 family beta-lactam sensor/signal transducer [Enterococcus pallens]EOH90209.1 hypothetical protein UAU_04038 [Enterococcus pallens ATCC BAA-351]EOU15185.1 hypothetical protein I588_04117 [Enterococcus pallens ATCC BAA-351]
MALPTIEQFLFNNVSVILYFVSLLLLRKTIGNRLNPKLRGIFWYLPFLSVFFFIPHQPLANLKTYLHYNLPMVRLFQNEWVDEIKPELIGTLTPSNSHWLNDYSLSAGASVENYAKGILMIWIAGIIIRGLILLFSLYKLHSWIKEGQVLESLKVQRSLARAQTRLNTQIKVTVIESKKIKTPATSGLLHPIILLPDCYSETITEDHLSLIFMHELGHHKNKDLYQQTLLLMFTVLFWYNPLVYWLASLAEKDREVACDSLVLSHLEESEIMNYGQVLLSSIIHRTNNQLAGFSTNKKSLAERIRLIASYQPKKGHLHLQFLTILLIISGFLVAIPQSEGSQNAPPLPASDILESVSDATFTANSQNSFVLYDEAVNQYSIYNESAAYQRFSPDSTYKLWSGLFGLKKGIIRPEQNQLTWDGTVYPFQAWNTSQGLKAALTNSTNWYFQQLDAQLGKAELTKNFSTIHYGNANLLGSVDNYWLESSLKIAAVEQVQLLNKLFNDELEFSTSDVQFMKEALKLESGTNYTLYGKTGTGKKQNQENRGWFVGWIETSENTYYFACHLQGEKVSGKTAASETLRILKEKAIYE